MSKRHAVTLGDRLRTARIKLKKTQFDVAKESGLRPEAVSRLENGKSGASLGSLHKLAPVLGLTLEELVDLSTAFQTAKEKSK